VATHASAGEVELVRHQYVNNLGVFACDNARAYADEEAIALAPEQNNTPFFISHAAPRSALGNKGWLLNVDTFQKVWDIIKADGLYAKYDVTVKVDPDTVFLPAKLKTKLQWNNPAEPWYVANCGQWGSMQGPLEIVSKAGVDKLTSGFGGCRQSINDGFSYWKWGSLPGEDMFVAECLDQLGVRKVQMFDVLADTNCGFNPAQGCHNTGNVCAFHKFKEPTQWSQCLDQLAK